MVPVVDLVLPEGSESVKDVVGRWVRLGVQEDAVGVDHGLCGRGKVV